MKYLCAGYVMAAQKKRIFYGHDMKLPFQMQSFEWVKNLRLYKFCGPITQHLYTNTNKDITLELYLLESNMVHYGLQTIHYTVEKGLADFWKPLKKIWVGLNYIFSTS